MDMCDITLWCTSDGLLICLTYLFTTGDCSAGWQRTAWQVFYIHTCAIWLVHMCAMTHWHVRHDPFLSVTWHIHGNGLRERFLYSCMWHNLLVCVTWLSQMSDMTRFCVWRDTYGHIPRDRYLYVWHDSFICVTKLIHTRVTLWYDYMTRFYVLHAWDIHVMCVCVKWHYWWLEGLIDAYVMCAW